ncbi:MAG: ABC transporter permease [Candidatus Paceibacterota bacterium]
MIIFRFLRELLNRRYLIYTLAKRDFQNQYTGSYFGVIWNFMQPIAFIFILWFVLSVGFNLRKVENTNHIFWLISGMICWLYFSEVFSTSTQIIQQYSFLIKKIDFSLGILPIVKIISAGANHFIFIFLTIIFGIFLDVMPTFYLIQIFYYAFALQILLLGLCWLASSTSIFVKDINNVVAIIVQFGFWLTPVFWSLDNVPQSYHWIIKLNPLSYLVTGYRDSLIYRIPFWEKPFETVYFWAVSLSILLIGALVFKRLRPHFAEVI